MSVFDQVLQIRPSILTYGCGRSPQIAVPSSRIVIPEAVNGPPSV